jgi:hypothetical protein
MAPVWPVFIDFCAVTKWSKTPQNMSFGSNGVGQLRLLRKILTQIRLANLCVNGANLASLHRLSCSNETVRDITKHEFWVQWSGSVPFVAKNSDATLFSELVR